MQQAAWTGKLCLPEFSFTFTFSRIHSFGELRTPLHEQIQTCDTHYAQMDGIQSF